MLFRSNGQGTYTFTKSGTKVKGSFKNGKFDGYCIEFFPNGDTFDGVRKQDQPDGPSIFTFADGVMTDGIRRDMRKIRATEIGDREFAEDVIENGCCVLDRVIALHEARRLEAREGEGFDIFIERHAILQAERNSDGEVVHERTERRAFRSEEHTSEPSHT